MKLDREILQKIPKIELHLHLDCSLSFDVIKQLIPGTSQEGYVKDFTAPEKCFNLRDYFRSVSNSVDLMQKPECLDIVVSGLFKELQKDNVLYAEIRFAPLLHLKEGLTPEAVVEIIANSTAKNSKATGIKAGLVLCTLRNYNQEQSYQVIQLTQRYIRNTCVAGFDIAGDEVGFPIDAHIKSFDFAKDRGIPITAHAGESNGPESIWESLRHFGTKRIGHGVRCIDDAKLIDHLIEKNIHLEICPTSNIKTNVFDHYSDHPINYLFEKGVSLSINTDGRSSAIFSLSEEYEKLGNMFSWDLNHFYACNINAIRHAFLSLVEKRKLEALYQSKFPSQY